MDQTYVDLQRRFRELTEDQANAPEAEELGWEWGWFADRHSKDWIALEARYRTVIIAEAGSGKTREMQERCNHLNNSGKYSFFLPLERLDTQDLTRLLETHDDASTFNKWKTSSSAIAWFFLDALDELKLREGVFPNALHNLKEAIQGDEHRARVIVSCRPSDWHLIDTTLFKRILPPPEILHEEDQSATASASILSSEERFVAPLRGKPQLSADESKPQDHVRSESERKRESLQIFWLSPLVEKQIENLIKGIKVLDQAGLVKEIRRTEAWDFARSPQDVIEISAHWEEHGTLGTRSEQYEAHIESRLRDRSNRPSQERQISYKKARIGAESLALAVAFTKKRSIHTLDEQGKTSRTILSLDPLKVLSDWTPSEVGSLLSLGIFDPPTFGRVRFHRRGVEEYLAASRIRHLAEKGLGAKKDVLRLFIAKGQSGTSILLESLRPVGAWLALWNSDLRNAIIKTDPEHLITHGDPERIPIENRVTILNETIKNALKSGARYPSGSPGSLRRFADESQKEVIRKAWPTPNKNDELLGFLLCLIRDGGLLCCCDLVNKVARSTSSRRLHRVLAVQALVGSNDKKRLQSLAKDIYASPSRWPAEVSGQVLDDFYPEFLSASKLLKIIVQLSSSENFNSQKLETALKTISRKIEPFSTEAIVLRKGLTSLIVENQTEDSTDYYPTSNFSWVSPSLATICVKQFPIVDESDWGDLFEACLTAYKFRPEYYYEKEDLEQLYELIKNLEFPIAKMFRAELEYVYRIFKDPIWGIPFGSRRSFGPDFSDEDNSWLEELVEDESSDLRIRQSALQALLRLWYSAVRPENREDTLRKLNLNEPSLQEQLAAGLKPIEVHPSEARSIEIAQAQKEKAEKRIQGWENWRSKLLSDPKSHFTPPELERTRRLLFDWLMADNKSNSTYRVWHRGVGLREAFGDEIEKLARQEFSSYWRGVDYKPFGSRSTNDTGTSYSWLYGLNGVLAEADLESWTSSLTSGEVRQATRLSLVELNGFAPYLNELETAHPKIVSKTLSEELTSELALANTSQFLPLLQDLTHATKRLKLSVSKPLLKFLDEWEEPAGDKKPEGFCYHHLSQALNILVEISSDLGREKLTTQWSQKLDRKPNSLAASHWLRALFAVDGASATTALENALKKVRKNAQTSFVVKCFGNVFDSFRGVSIHFVEEDHRASVLGRLCRIAYTHINPSEDEVSPDDIANIRSNAQSGRSRLLNELIESTDPEAQILIEQLATDPVFESVRDWLNNRVRVREIQSAEPPPLTLESIKTVERCFERLPVDRDSIYQLMLNRLKDLQHDISHHSFFPRKTAQSIKREEEMQRLLSLLLELGSNNTFCVVREDEVADSKITDIKLLSIGFDARAVIEIKVADQRWSTNDLIRAINAQLTGQYLRHERCKAGCLLLTYNGDKKFWVHPKTRKRLNFTKLVSFLSIEAKEIAKERDDGILIDVVGLDFRDPVLPNAHG